MKFWLWVNSRYKRLWASTGPKGGALKVNRAELSPVDFEAVPRRDFHPDKSLVAGRLLAQGSDLLFENAEATGQR